MRGFVVVAALTTTAHASPMSITGTVIDARSQWAGDRIVTDTTIQTATGDAVVVRQLGGTVDGVGMMTFPGQPRLVLGMQVALAAHEGVDLAAHSHVEVDDVRVLAVPEGFVRSGPTVSGHYLYWESGCIFVTYDAAGTAQLAGDTEFGIIDASIATWNTDTASCSYMKVMKQGVKPMEVGKDDVNVIKFRDTGCGACGMSWCRPATMSDPAKCYPAAAAGITTVTYINDMTSSRDGAIVDADIEINGASFAISDQDVTLGSQPCHAELQNTMTHELGHLHGLEHTCLADYETATRVDDMGNPVPLCSATSDPKITEATMYPYQDCGETKKESLEADDINSMCVIYPTAKSPETCEAVQLPAGCSCAGSRSPGGAIVMSLVVGLVLRRRRMLASTPASD
jgi:MYXO-CTERM domain-containing protein